MDMRNRRSIWVVASVSVAILGNMCALVAGGPVERLFARKDLPHGPAFGFYRTVWHEWPGTQENVRYESELAEELLPESIPDEGPELFPPGDIPELEAEPYDPSREPPSQERPPGFENGDESDDDPAPSPPSLTPMDPTEIPDGPIEDAPETPSEELELPPGLEETDVEPEEVMSAPPNHAFQSNSVATSTRFETPRRLIGGAKSLSQDTSDRQARGTVNRPSMPMRIGSAIGARPMRNSAVFVPHPASLSNEQNESGMESTSSYIHNPLRAAPLARAKRVPALRQASSTTKHVNYTTRSVESRVRKLRTVSQPANGRRSTRIAAFTATGPLNANPLRVGATDSAANDVGTANPLR